MIEPHPREAPQWGTLRIQESQRKARRCFPGVIGEALAAELDVAWDLLALLGPRSLAMRLLTVIEALPEPEAKP